MARAHSRSMAMTSSLVDGGGRAGASALSGKAADRMVWRIGGSQWAMAGALRRVEWRWWEVSLHGDG